MSSLLPSKSDVDAQGIFIKQFLSDAPPYLALPTDKPRPPELKLTRADFECMLPFEIIHELKNKFSGYPTADILIASFNILLYQYTHQADIIIGAALKTHQEQRSEQNYDFAPIPLHYHIEGNTKFEEILNAGKNLLQDANKIKSLSREQILSRLNIYDCPSCSPLFQVLFYYSTQEDLRNISIYNNNLMQKSDLCASIRETNATLNCSLNYNTSLFEKETIERMARQWQVIISQLLTNNEILTKDLLKLHEIDAQQISLWNQTEFGPIEKRPIQVLFEEAVVLNPTAVALMHEGFTLSYKQLNQRANQLAAHLLSYYVNNFPENKLMGICLDKSIDTIVSILAILKAGFGYVPLDPINPLSKLHYIIDDTNLTHILTDQRHAQEFATLEKPELQLYCLDAQHQDISWQSMENLALDYQCSDVAYVLYTSGSSGKAKGVMVEQSSVVNALKWLQRQFTLKEDDRVLQFTPYGYDNSISEIFWPLIHGLPVVIPKSCQANDFDYLITCINQNKVTTMQIGPVLLNSFIEYLTPDNKSQVTSLRRIFTGGADLTRHLKEKILQKLNINLYITYGLTETPVTTCRRLCSLDKHKDRNCEPIGNLVNNLKFYVLDDYMQPVPVGVYGELYVGGIGIAKGYVNNQVLTQERFIHNPFASPAELNANFNTRLYRTGDYVRWLPNGDLEYLGRSNGGMRISGYSIPLNEIEACLMTFSLIKEVVVLLYTNAFAKTMVVAFFTLKKQFMHTEFQTDVMDSELKNHIAHHLPSFMMPELFIKLEQMPLTANGKIDRQLLLKIPQTT
ncbi:non-ribosomal peptide synthetase [Legionella saoudiensis]|uniref:non-ribosomal peptide synthetase n=1 Tax=Legionella saoudiensis TaxID=1750561 RepID=UPI00073116C0|nr:amino acid adenylation domain-containing protein [Legionella saoudiensis]